MQIRLGPLQPSPLKISFVLETCSLKEIFTVRQIGTDIGSIMRTCCGPLNIFSELWDVKNVVYMLKLCW